MAIVRRQGTRIVDRSSGHAVSMAAAKRQLRIEPDDTDQDEYIEELCAAAHQFVESQLGFPIMRQTRRTDLSGFPSGAIWLGGGAALTVGAVKYIDAAGTQQMLASSDYIVDAVSIPAALHPAPLKTWPSAQARPSAVQIEWTAGWANPADVPADLIHAMKLLIGHWDQTREAASLGTLSKEVEFAIAATLAPYRIQFFG